MKTFNRARALKFARQAQAEKIGPLKIRPPIEPSRQNVEIPENHPLYQFFDSKRQYIRKANDLEDSGSPWTIAQLRRKGFDDLHQLWYICLKENNKLAREERLLMQHTSRPGKDAQRSSDESNVFTSTMNQIKTTMWRIRHVLAERYHAHKQLTVFGLEEDFNKAFAEFKEKYLTADSNADGDVNAQLERFQFAFYGINPLLETNFPDPLVVKGLYVVAQLKLERYGSEQTDITDVQDIREAYTLFTCEPNPQGVGDAIETIKQVRESGGTIPRDRDVEVLAELMSSD